MLNLLLFFLVAQEEIRGSATDLEEDIEIQFLEDPDLTRFVQATPTLSSEQGTTWAKAIVTGLDISGIYILSSFINYQT